MWLCYFHIISFSESPHERRMLIVCCLFVVRILKPGGTNWPCALGMEPSQGLPCLMGSAYSMPTQREESAVMGQPCTWTRQVYEDRGGRPIFSSHLYSALLLGSSGLPSISLWPQSQFSFPFLTTQTTFPEEDEFLMQNRICLNKAQNGFSSPCLSSGKERASMSGYQRRC